MFKWLNKKFRIKREDQKIKNDVLGSYTGVTENPYEKPEQDADDL